MSLNIKNEVEHLKLKAKELRDKIEELMSRPETPDYDEQMGGLNSTLEDVINEIELNEN